MTYTLGIICFGLHESAAVLVSEGRVIAAAEEERFSRNKFDAAFPLHAINFCLDFAQIKARDLSGVGFAFDPRRKTLQKVAHIVRYFPKSINLFLRTRHRMSSAGGFHSDFRKSLNYDGTIVSYNHHLCHAASSFFASPFESSSILVIDGVGDWESVWWGQGEGTKIQVLGKINWPFSLGHIYAAVTEYLGFKPFSDEYKVMGLASYGKPSLRKEVAEVFFPTPTGFGVNFKYFDFQFGGPKRFSRHFVSKFGPPAKDPDAVDSRYRDIAASFQEQLENVLFALVEMLVKKTGDRRLCLAGGVAMNCVANGKLLSSGIVRDLFVPPCASDSGAALGAAYLMAKTTANASFTRAPLETAHLGPEYESRRILNAIQARGLMATEPKSVTEKAAELLAGGSVLGWFEGRMEFGQRALGARSILADPRQTDMKDLITVKVKFRETFRPFAPSIFGGTCWRIFFGMQNDALHDGNLRRDRIQENIYSCRDSC